jgi:NADPH-dependent 2,4-dienoyl-CoA reductase/sulfur reductase-like enzyme
MNQHKTAHCDLLIIGAGPAGLAAAVAAAPSGATITVIDDNPMPGGQIWRDGPNVRLPASARELREALARHSNIKVVCGTRVVAALPAKQLLLEGPDTGWRQGYDKLILCTGARELLLPYPGWTLPGVTGAGGLQALIKGGMPVQGERIVIAGTGPLLLAVAASAQAAGAQVLRVAEQASLRSVLGFGAGLLRWPAKVVQAATLWTPHYRTSSHVVAVQGDGRVQSVQLRQGAGRVTLACDRVACGYGLIPNTQLGQALGCAVTPGQALQVDRWQTTSRADHFAAGECTGVGGGDKALIEGTIAGLAAVGDLDQAKKQGPERHRWHIFAHAFHHHFALNPAIQQLPAPDTVVCRCEDVTHSELRGHSNWTAAKLHTRCGMGACQGRICGAAAQYLYGWEPPVPRSPLSPARIGTLACQGPTPE